MSQRLTAVLGWLTLILVLGALWVLFGEDPTRNAGARGGLLFETGAERLSSVTDITLEQGDDRLDLKASGDAWVLASRNDFPADIAKARGLLRGLILSKRREPKTSNRTRFDQLNLVGPEAIKLLLKDAAGGVVADMLIGKRSEGATGRSLTYVYLEGDSRAWLVSDIPALSALVSDWVLPKALSLDQTRIKAAAMQGYRLEATEQGGAPALSPIPEGREQEADWKTRGAFRTLSSLDFTDIEKVANPLYDPKGVISLTTFDGLSVDLTLYQPAGSDDLWFGFKAAYTLDAAETGAAGVVEAAPADGAAEADRLNALANGWLFKASPELKDTLLSGQEAYLLPKVEEAPAG